MGLIKKFKDKVRGKKKEEHIWIKYPGSDNLIKVTNDSKQYVVPGDEHVERNHYDRPSTSAEGSDRDNRYEIRPETSISPIDNWETRSYTRLLRAHERMEAEKNAERHMRERASPSSSRRSAPEEPRTPSDASSRDVTFDQPGSTPNSDGSSPYYLRKVREPRHGSPVFPRQHHESPELRERKNYKPPREARPQRGAGWAYVWPELAPQRQGRYSWRDSTFPRWEWIDDTVESSREGYYVCKEPPSESPGAVSPEAGPVRSWTVWRDEPNHGMRTPERQATAESSVGSYRPGSAYPSQNTLFPTPDGRSPDTRRQRMPSSDSRSSGQRTSSSGSGSSEQGTSSRGSGSSGQGSGSSGQGSGSSGQGTSSGRGNGSSGQGTSSGRGSGSSGQWTPAWVNQPPARGTRSSRSGLVERRAPARTPRTVDGRSPINAGRPRVVRRGRKPETPNIFGPHTPREKPKTSTPLGTSDRPLALQDGEEPVYITYDREGNVEPLYSNLGQGEDHEYGNIGAAEEDYENLRAVRHTEPEYTELEFEPERESRDRKGTAQNDLDETVFEEAF